MHFSMVGDMKGVNSEQVSGEQAFSGAGALLMASAGPANRYGLHTDAIELY